MDKEAARMQMSAIAKWFNESNEQRVRDYCEFYLTFSQVYVTKLNEEKQNGIDNRAL